MIYLFVWTFDCQPKYAEVPAHSCSHTVRHFNKRKEAKQTTLLGDRLDIGRRIGCMKRSLKCTISTLTVILTVLKFIVHIINNKKGGLECAFLE